MKNLSQGFTLIELMVVMSIIAVLVGTISIGISAAQAQGRDTKRKADLRAIQQALELYKQDNAIYPASLGGCASFWGANNTTYLQEIPCDPKFGVSYPYAVSSGNYTLTACLENANDPQGDLQTKGSISSSCAGSANSYTVTNPQ